MTGESPAADPSRKEAKSERVTKIANASTAVVGSLIAVGTAVGGAVTWWTVFFAVPAPPKESAPPPPAIMQPPQVVISPTVIISPTFGTGQATAPPSSQDTRSETASAAKPAVASGSAAPPPASPPVAVAPVAAAPVVPVPMAAPTPAVPIVTATPPPVVTAVAVPVAPPPATTRGDGPRTFAGCTILGAAPIIRVKPNDVLCSSDGSSRIVIESMSGTRLYYLDGRNRQFCLFGELCGLRWSDAPRFTVRPSRMASDEPPTVDLVMQ